MQHYHSSSSPLHSSYVRREYRGSRYLLPLFHRKRLSLDSKVAFRCPVLLELVLLEQVQPEQPEQVGPQRVALLEQLEPEQVPLVLAEPCQ